MSGQVASKSKHASDEGWVVLSSDGRNELGHGLKRQTKNCCYAIHSLVFPFHSPAAIRPIVPEA